MFYELDPSEQISMKSDYKSQIFLEKYTLENGLYKLPIQFLFRKHIWQWPLQNVERFFLFFFSLMCRPTIVISHGNQQAPVSLLSPDPIIWLSQPSLADLCLDSVATRELHSHQATQWQVAGAIEPTSIQLGE